MSQIRFTIITLFPEALRPYLESSMLYKAQERGIIAVDYVNLRDFGLGPHKSVDDTPYGGGDGMLLRCEPVFAAIESVKATSPEAEVILPTPVGQIWDQNLARQFAGVSTPEDAENLAKMAQKRSLARSHSGEKTEIDQLSPENAPEAPSENAGLSDQGLNINASDDKIEASGRHFVILCPHYEGYDERILSIVDHPISLGKYVLTGGELAALVIIDSVTRLLPGVLGGETSATIESFSAGDNLEYPQYTKPAEFRGMSVPEVLLSGNHAKIAEWRADQSRRIGKG